MIVQTQSTDMEAYSTNVENKVMVEKSCMVDLNIYCNIQYLLLKYKIASSNDSLEIFIIF